MHNIARRAFHILKKVLSKTSSGRRVLQWIISFIIFSRKYHYIAITYLFNKIKKYIYYKRRYADNSKPITIIFLVHLPSSWSALESIYKSCVNDESINPVIVTIPRKQPNSNQDWLYNTENHEYFTDQGIGALCGYDEENNTWLDLRSLRPDVVFVQTPYESQRYSGYSSSRLNEYTRICYLQYAFIITAGTFETHYYNLDFHRNCWRLFAETDYHKGLYEKYAPDLVDNVVVSGYPKFDAYLEDLPDEDSIWKLPRKNSPDVKRIIWSPHWTINDEYLRASNFLNYNKYILELARKHENIEIIVRPHPFLFKELINGQHWTQQQLNNYIETIENMSNISIDLSPGYFHMFRTSDMLIADNGSFLGEYLPTENPVVYTHSYESDDHNLSEYGQALTQHHYIARNESELEDHIQRVAINGDDYKREDRLRTMNKYLYLPEAGAGQYIKTYIKEAFGL